MIRQPAVILETSLTTTQVTSTTLVTMRATPLPPQPRFCPDSVPAPFILARLPYVDLPVADIPGYWVSVIQTLVVEKQR
jgi:hypothetical protein